MASQDWKFPPTPPPYVNEGCFAVESPTKGHLLVADRGNQDTRPVERDSNVAFAWLAMTYHDMLVDALTRLSNAGSTDTKERARSKAILTEIEIAVKRLDR